MTVRLTRRGWTVAVVVVVAVVLAWLFGQRSLNAVAAPALAGLALAAVTVWYADPPTVVFDEVRAGFPDEQRTVSFRVEGGGLARVRQSLPTGLGGRPIDETSPLSQSFEQQIGLEARGVYEVGPPEVRQRDALGLVERRVETDASVELVVYPQVYTLADPTLGGVLSDPMTAERQEFDHLREYVPGDPLQRVHWKSSAKRDEFLVMEFAPTDRTEALSVAAAAESGQADRMARAVATLTAAAFEADLTVELWVPDDHLPLGKGDAHRENAMHMLATADHGSVGETARAAADVTVSAGPRSTVVSLPDGQRSFESLVTGWKKRTDEPVDRETERGTKA